MRDKSLVIGALIRSLCGMSRQRGRYKLTKSGDTSLLPNASSMSNDALPRCGWCGPGGDEVMQIYHDTEWGVPVRHNDNLLFEMLSLEGAQAGLSWRTILLKREGYRRLFAHFDIETVAQWDAEETVNRLASDASIVRHRGKIASVVTNAQAIMALRQSQGCSFSDFLWNFVESGVPALSRISTVKEIPTQTKESLAMSKSLKCLKFKYCGPTICYAFMQAIGMVNDHETSCFRFKELTQGS